MQRRLDQMAARHHDILIIGGGITGACIARDAALRGLDVALVEQADFSSATSAGSSKLVHGGLRYLANFELGLVRESLRERRIWEAIAPHMVTPVPFLIPLYGVASALKLKIGLTLYDALSYDRNRLDDPDKHMPRHRRISRDEALARAPFLNQHGLTGALIYYDCQMYSPERLGVECIGDAADNGAHVANYARVDALLTEPAGAETGAGRTVTGARVRDMLDGAHHDVKARLTINATGPWGDMVMALAAHDGAPARSLIRSKGIHLITRKLTDDMALAVQPKDGGHFFVIPWRDHTLIGTTDTVFKGRPDALGVSEDDIADFLAVINAGLPGLSLTRDDVQHFYAGLRPLVDTNPNADEKDSYGASRAAEIVDHATDGVDNLLSALGGKWTTSRHLAEQVVDQSLVKLGRAKAACVTAARPVLGGEITRYRDFEEAAIRRLPHMAVEVVRNLARNYGSRMDDVVDIARQENRPDLLEPLSNSTLTIAAQALYAVRMEMARSLDDVLQRRTGLGTLGHPGHDTVMRIADIVGDELGWDPSERARQVALAEQRFVTRDDFVTRDEDNAPRPA